MEFLKELFLEKIKNFFKNPQTTKKACKELSRFSSNEIEFKNDKGPVSYDEAHNINANI